MSPIRRTAIPLTDPCTTHGEGPFWDPVAQRLLVVDMLAGAIVEVTTDGGTCRHELGGVAAAIRRRDTGGFVLAVERGFRFLTDELAPTGEVVSAFDDSKLRMNDGGCDPQGRFYCGTMAYDEAPGAGTLYRLDPESSVHPVLSGLTISNGLQWSADGQSAFHNDTPTGRIDRYAFDPQTGQFGERTTFAVVEDGPGQPDGMAIDVDGGIWIALWGGGAVRHYDAAGTLVEVIELPVPDVTACAFGGPQLDTLYISTSRVRADHPGAGAVFSVRSDVLGAPLPAFAG